VNRRTSMPRLWTSYAVIHSNTVFPGFRRE